jgi:hypothetical protein
MNFVGHHCFAIPRAPEHDAALAFAASDCFCSWANEKRIVHGFFAECAEVFYLMSKSAEQFFHYFFVTKTSVI